MQNTSFCPKNTSFFPAFALFTKQFISHKIIHFTILRILLLIWPGLVCLTGCQEPTESPTVVSDEGQISRISNIAGIPLEMIEKANLKEVWMVDKLPLGRSGRVKKIFYHDGLLFVVDRTNTLHALDGANGIIKWTQQLGKRDASFSEPYYYQDKMIMVIGNTVYECGVQSGLITYQRDLDFVPTTNVVRSQDKMFIGTTNRHFYALRMSDAVPVWQSIQPEPPTGVSALADDRVFFVCQNGALYVSRLSERDLLWSRDTEGRTPGVVVDGQQCFLPSTDTALYCFDVTDGSLLWRFHSGGDLTTLPVVTGNYVYQSIDQKALVCLDKNSDDIKGSMRWKLTDGKNVIAEKDTVSYVMTLDQQLVLMDNQTGRQILSFYVPNLNLGVTNNQDDMIFLANRQGALVALRPE